MVRKMWPLVSKVEDGKLQINFWFCPINKKIQKQIRWHFPYYKNCNEKVSFFVREKP